MKNNFKIRFRLLFIVILCAPSLCFPAVNISNSTLSPKSKIDKLAGDVKDFERKKEFYLSRFQKILDYSDRDKYFKKVKAILGLDSDYLSERIAVKIFEACDQDDDLLLDTIIRSLAEPGYTRNALYGLLLDMAYTYEEFGPIEKAIRIYSYLCNQDDNLFIAGDATFSLADIWGRFYTADPAKGRVSCYSKAISLLDDKITQLQSADAELYRGRIERMKVLKKTIQERQETVSILQSKRNSQGYITKYLVEGSLSKEKYGVYSREVPGTWACEFSGQLGLSSLDLFETLKVLAMYKINPGRVIIQENLPENCRWQVHNEMAVVEGQPDTLYLTKRFVWSRNRYFVERFKEMIGDFDFQIDISGDSKTAPDGNEETEKANVALVPVTAINKHGILIVAESLSSKGYTVNVPDEWPKDRADSTNPGDWNYLGSDAISAFVSNTGANIVGLGLSRDGMDSVESFISSNPDAYIVIGGPMGYLIEQLLAKFPKANIICVQGDGEEAMPKICEIIGGTRPSRGLSAGQWRRLAELDIPGVFIRVNNPAQQRDSVRVLVKDIGTLNRVEKSPLPDIELMRKAWSVDDPYIARIRLNNGCPYNCPFCDMVGGRFVNLVEKDTFIGWLKQLSQRDDVREAISRGRKLAIMFEGENVLVNRPYMMSLLKDIADLRLNEYFTFDCQASIETLLNSKGEADTEYITALSAAGFKNIGFGVDGTCNEHIILHKSGSPGQVRYKIQDVFTVSRALKEHGIRPWNYAILSNPYTTTSLYLKSLFVYHTSHLFNSPRNSIEQDKGDLDVMVPAIIATGGHNTFQDEDIMHYPGSQQRGYKTQVNGLIAIDRHAAHSILAFSKYVLSAQITTDFDSKFSYHMENEFFNLYPEYVIGVIASFLNEEDRQMQAFGSLLKFYLTESCRLKRKVTLTSMLTDISFLMLSCHDYVELLNNIERVTRIISKKPAIEDSDNFETACNLPQGFMNRIHAIPQKRVLAFGTNPSMQSL